mgnify:CR=1 FL=1
MTAWLPLVLIALAVLLASLRLCLPPRPRLARLSLLLALQLAAALLLGLTLFPPRQPVPADTLLIASADAAARAEATAREVFEQGGAGGIQGAQLAQVEAGVGRHFAAQARHLALQSRVVGERPITYGSDAGGLGGAIQAHVAGLRLCRHGAEAYTGFSVPE